MKVVVLNLGCKVNQYEADGIYHKLYELGYDVSNNLEVADAYILNTCAVTNEAEKKSRQMVSKCLKLNKDARIIICGCASENNSEQFSSKAGVSYVSGTEGKGNVVDMLNKNGVYVTPIKSEFEDNLSPEVVRTRAYVKVQDGCDNFCAYCLIPYVRGRSRSRQIESIVRECERLQSKVKEIVITGIDISSYGKNINSNLADLLEHLAHIDARLRLGSLEVNVISRDLLEATKKLKAFCPHFHLSLQSGDDTTLRNMNRHYTTNEYLEKVSLIREYYPLTNITTDLICGFPTETDEQFENTLDFLKKVEFGSVHAFAYSKRNGTKAEKLGMLDSSIVKERMNKLDIVINQLKENYLSKFLGQKVEVLLEDNGGYTREYVRCNTQGNEGDLIEFVPTKMKNFELY